MYITSMYVYLFVFRKYVTIYLHLIEILHYKVKPSAANEFNFKKSVHLIGSIWWNSIAPNVDNI